MNHDWLADAGLPSNFVVRDPSPTKKDCADAFSIDHLPLFFIRESS